MDGGKSEDTPDAFGNVVGKMVMATPSQLQEVIALVKDLRANPPKADQRDLFRAIEKDIFDFQADALVGHQAMDFHKQDGLTEIEESVKANYVERQLNDALLQAEREGKVNISRVPAFVEEKFDFLRPKGAKN
jgi:cob(I)alamin adenosyltransferase